MKLADTTVRTLADLSTARASRTNRHNYHWTTRNDETLCGRLVVEYVDFFGVYLEDGDRHMCDACSRSQILRFCSENTEAQRAREAEAARTETTPVQEDPMSNQELIALVRRDDAATSRAVFTKMVADLGRNEASERWVAATAKVEAEDPMDPPSMVAPDCDMQCGESYLDPGCNPCVTLESIRYPKVQVQPFECPCGFRAAGDQNEAILDHAEACNRFGES